MSVEKAPTAAFLLSAFGDHVNVRGANNGELMSKLSEIQLRQLESGELSFSFSGSTAERTI